MTVEQKPDQPNISTVKASIFTEEAVEAISGENEENVFIKFLRLNKPFRLPAISLSVLLILAVIAGLGYFCWYLWLPRLWIWGFEPASWRAILSVVGTIYLVIIPFLPLLLINFIGDIVSLYLKEQEDIISEKFSILDKGQESIETELINNDNAGLIPVIRYSRLQLEAYYRIGLDQTHRSFRYSIIAMWIGFVVIISGVGINFLPTSFRSLFEVSNVRDISIAGGTIIEIISALFLWVYRSSISQLTYFYNRQMDNHNVLICQRIAETMEDSDETKKLIIEKVLERGQKSEISSFRIPGLSKSEK